MIDDFGRLAQALPATTTPVLCGAHEVPESGVAIIEARSDQSTVQALHLAWRARRCAVLVDARAPEDRKRAMIATALGCPALSDAAHGYAAGLFTSGSSGEPKLVIHRATSLVANAAASNARVPYGPGDRWLLSLSPHHIGGLSIIVRSLLAGASTHIGGGPSTVAADLLAHPDITHVSLVATQLRRLLDDPAARERLRHTKAVLLGGGPAPAAWRHEAVRAGMPLYASYGLTECASQVATGRATIDDDAGATGPPLDGVEIDVTAEGELRVRGPTTFAGYVRGSRVVDVRNAERWYATGDLGSVDRRGCVHVQGRRDALFISGGENVHPEEIENALREVPGITQACVVAVDDDRWQKRPVAFVLGTFRAADLEAVLARRLERFRWPDRIYALTDEEASQAKIGRARLLARLPSATTLWSR